MPQSIRLERQRVNFTLSGPDVEPLGAAWMAASRDERATFWRILADVTFREKDKSLKRGQDVNGDKIRPAKVKYRIINYKDRGLEWKGPGLMPQYADSRTRRLLKTMVYPPRNPDRVIGYWRMGWGRILGYHARGEVKGAPVRNVVGLSDKLFEKVVREARAEWYRQVGKGIDRRLNPTPPTRPLPPPPKPPAPPTVKVPAPVPPKPVPPPQPPAFTLPPGDWTPEQIELIRRYPEMAKYLKPAGGSVFKRATRAVGGAARKVGRFLRGLFGG